MLSNRPKYLKAILFTNTWLRWEAAWCSHSASPYKTIITTVIATATVRATRLEVSSQSISISRLS